MEKHFFLLSSETVSGYVAHPQARMSHLSYWPESEGLICAVSKVNIPPQSEVLYEQAIVQHATLQLLQQQQRVQMAQQQQQQQQLLAQAQVRAMFAIARAFDIAARASFVVARAI